MSGQSVLARHDTRRAVCLPDLLQQQVSAQPDATAVTGGGERLSYRQLGEAAGVLGAQLYHLGVRADDCVGLYVEPSLELMMGAWGILYAGAAYLPLSPEYPADRVRYMIEDSRTRVIVTQEHLRARLAELTPQGTLIVTPNDGHDAHGGPGESGLAAAHPIPYQSHGPGGPPPAPAPSRWRTSSTPPAAPAGPRA
ncbi:AMP-binding protein [Kitasatospora sp. NPDC050543]|uniref:AMP-binding protein n=1 Tax=Kitasatospora sp. NPDC050543 TaxID=3364054 RepID=UPI0037A33672